MCSSLSSQETLIMGAFGCAKTPGVPAGMAVGVAVFFLGVVACAKFAGHWDTDLPRRSLSNSCRTKANKHIPCLKHSKEDVSSTTLRPGLDSGHETARAQSHENHQFRNKGCHGGRAVMKLSDG